MRHFPSRFILIIPLLLLTLSGPARAEMDTAAEQLARWQLNNADLLVDQGRYMQAIEYIDSAYETSQYAKTRADALLSRAMVLGTFLDAPKEAANAYERLAREFPQYKETAAYQIPFLYMQAEEQTKARQGFKSYIATYPNGRFRFQAEALLQSLGESPEQGQTSHAVEGHPVMRVLLVKNATSVRFSGSGASLCMDQTGCVDNLVFTFSDRLAKINGFPYAARDYEVKSSRPIQFVSGKHALTVRGKIQVRTKGGRYQVLNLIDMEDYLRAVVPSESYASWPAETLKAQAVAARTYAYYQKLHRKSRAYDVRADTFDQMYGGIKREDKRTDQAVWATKGQVLTYNNKPILSQFTANSGGTTADAGAVFDTPKPYLVSHSDPASLKGKMASWKRTYTTAQIEQALGKIGVNVHGLTSIQAAKTGPSGRMVKVRLNYAGKSRVLRTRTTLASSRVLKLPEVLLRIERQGDTYIFHGHGHGHGVGYSQWGGAELGKTENYGKILDFYYPHTKLSVLWK